MNTASFDSTISKQHVCIWNNKKYAHLSCSHHPEFSDDQIIHFGRTKPESTLAFTPQLLNSFIAFQCSTSEGYPSGAPPTSSPERVCRLELMIVSTLRVISRQSLCADQMSKIAKCCFNYVDFLPTFCYSYGLHMFQLFRFRDKILTDSPHKVKLAVGVLGRETCRVTSAAISAGVAAT